MAFVAELWSDMLHVVGILVHHDGLWLVVAQIYVLNLKDVTHVFVFLSFVVNFLEMWTVVIGMWIVVAGM